MKHIDTETHTKKSHKNPNIKAITHKQKASKVKTTNKKTKQKTQAKHYEAENLQNTIECTIYY